MPRIVPTQFLRFIVSIPVIALLAAHCPAVARQKSARPPAQRQLEERVKELEKRLTDSQQKAESVTKALENRLGALDEKITNAPTGENARTLTMILPSLAFLISFVTLWKGHFARFSPLA